MPHSCVVPALRLKLYQAQQGCRGNRQTQPTAHSWEAAIFPAPLPPSQFCPGSYSLRQNKPDKSWSAPSQNFHWVSHSSVPPTPKGWPHILVWAEKKKSVITASCSQNKQRDKRRRGEILLQIDQNDTLSNLITCQATSSH